MAKLTDGAILGPGERAADQAADEGAEAVARVERGHQRTTEVALDVDGLSVHGHVEQAAGEARS